MKDKDTTNDEPVGLLLLLADIRAAVGDPTGKLMQDELVEHCRRMAYAAEMHDLCCAHLGACADPDDPGPTLLESICGVERERNEPLYTTSEIAEYLSGWSMGSFGAVKGIAAATVHNALAQLNDPQDGIEACKKRDRYFPPVTEKGSPVGDETSEPETHQPETVVDLSGVPAGGTIHQNTTP